MYAHNPPIGATPMPWDGKLGVAGEVETTRLGESVRSFAKVPEPEPFEPFMSIVSPNGLGQGTQVKLNGVPLRFLTGVKVELGVGNINKVELTLGFVRLEQLDLSAADITVDAQQIPEPVQRALWERLNNKFMVL